MMISYANQVSMGVAGGFPLVWQEVVQGIQGARCDRPGSASWRRSPRPDRPAAWRTAPRVTCPRFGDSPFRSDVQVPATDAGYPWPRRIRASQVARRTQPLAPAGIPPVTFAARPGKARRERRPSPASEAGHGTFARQDRRFASRCPGNGGGGWIRTSVGFPRRIYSPLHLTALPPLRGGGGDVDPAPGRCQGHALAGFRFRA